MSLRWKLIVLKQDYVNVCYVFVLIFLVVIFNSTLRSHSMLYQINYFDGLDCNNHSGLIRHWERKWAFVGKNLKEIN